MSRSPSAYALALATLLCLTLALLHFMGQPWWCQQGDMSPWSSEVASAHNSQHLADPYTLTHVLHGIGFYAILWAMLGSFPNPGAILGSHDTRGAAPRSSSSRFSQRDRFVIAMTAEAAWEVFENTDFVIQRYRDNTISLDYFGDSVLNSLGDITAAALGYGAAMTLPVWSSVALFAGIEVLLLLWIRDSLLLNILMLAWPLDAVANWQAGG